MPIVGLTDRGLRFPEIGHIRKGDKVTKKRSDGSTYEVPVDLDYFRVVIDEHEVESAERFRKVYGDRPQEINIWLPFDDIDQFWSAWKEAYTAGRMIARSDGQHVRYRVNHATGEPDVLNGVNSEGIPVSHPADDVAGRDYENKEVKYQNVGRLHVIIPELQRAAYLVVHTSSDHDIANIDAQLKAFKYLNNGRLAGIPFVLRRRPRQISVPMGKDKKRVRKTSWLLSIEADPQWVAAKIEEINRAALPAGVDVDTVNPLMLGTPQGTGEVDDNGYGDELPFGDLHEEQPTDAKKPVKTTAGKQKPASQQVVDSTVTETNPPLPAPPPAQNGRPYPPELVKTKIHEAAERMPEFTPTKEQKSLLRYGLELCFVGVSDRNALDSYRHIVLQFLNGTPSIEGVGGKLFRALVEVWLVMKKDATTGDYSISENARQEARAIVRTQLMAEGQMEFDFD